MPSPQLVISPADPYLEESGPPTPWKGDMRNGSFTDLPIEKQASPKTGATYGEYHDYMMSSTSMSTYTDQSGMDFSSSMPGPSAGGPSAGPRTPTVARKGTETLIMMSAGSSGTWLNHIVVVNKAEPIGGTYYIDPNLDVPDHATAVRAQGLSKKAHSRSTSSLSKSGKQKADASWHPTTAPEACNAFFETKTGNVEIFLSIGGVGNSRAQKANIDVKAKQGRAVVKVVEIVEGRRLNLDVATGKGEIEVFLPRTFSGPLHVHTEGEITLLPRLAAAMEVITAREDDALVMVTPSTKVPPSPTASSSSRAYQDHLHRSGPGGFSQWLHPSGGSVAQSYQGDFVNLVSTGGGAIKVGFLDDEKAKEESPGLWTKFVRMLAGKRSESV